MILLLLFIAIGWLYVCYLVGKSIVGFFNRRNQPISVGRKPYVKSTLLENTLTLASLTAFIVIITIFMEVAYGLLTTQDGMVGVDFNLKRKVRTLTFLYGVWFSPGTMVAVVYILYIVERFLGRARSYPVELSTFPAAAYIIVARLVLQGM